MKAFFFSKRADNLDKTSTKAEISAPGCGIYFILEITLNL